MANLASPRHLRMGAWSTPLSTTRHRPSSGTSSSVGFGLPVPRSSAEPKAAATPGYEYTSSMESVPTPMGGESWNSSFPHNPFTSDLQPSQRVVHTQVFKWFTWNGTPTSTWIFLPWNCRPCEGQLGLFHKWMAWSLQYCQLLASLLPYRKSAINFLSDWAAWATGEQWHPWKFSGRCTSRGRCGGHFQHGSSRGNCRSRPIGAQADQPVGTRPVWCFDSASWVQCSDPWTAPDPAWWSNGEQPSSFHRSGTRPAW